jgi:hypothetical protein
MKTMISFRLRNVLDADLIALEVDEEKLADICRDGLRLMLGIRTAKHIEVKEKVIALPTSVSQATTEVRQQSQAGKPYVPKIT